MAPRSGPVSVSCFVCCLIVVATALPARDHAAVAPVDRSGHRAAVSPWANGHAAWTDADGGVTPTIPIIAVVAVPPDLNVDALGHLEILGLGRSSRWGSHQQHHCGCRQDESNPHHRASSLGIYREPQSTGTWGSPWSPLDRSSDCCRGGTCSENLEQCSWDGAH